MTLELNNISLSINDRVLFSSLSTVVSGGEMICVMGETGCGKTTLLRCILGLQPLDSGIITLGGAVLTSLSSPELRKRMLYVPQELSFPIDTVKDLLEMLLTLSVNKINNVSSKNLFAEWERLKLDTSLYDKRLSDISGGERQRIMLSVSGLIKREVLLVDEPTSALDSETSLLVAGYLQTIARRGTCIVAVSHDRVFAQQCNRILQM